MRVLVYEHLCTLADVTSSLRAEGWAMLAAAVADFAACEGVTPVALVEPGLVERVQAIAANVEVHSASAGMDVVFRWLASECPFALVIAPEFDQILETRCDWVVEAGGTLLGPSPKAVWLCSNKSRLATCLLEHECPAPRTKSYQAQDIPASGYPYVVKPRRGAGTQSTFLVRNRHEYVAAGTTSLADVYHGDHITQPFCPGQPASVAVIAGPRRLLTLPPAEQRIVTTPETGQMRYTGGTVRYPSEFTYADQLARCVAGIVPGLAGYFGIDLVLNGSNSVVIELNPRLTTSYIGLRRLSNVNLMQVLLEVAQGKEPVALSWRNTSVHFDPDGTIHEEGVT